MKNNKARYEKMALDAVEKYKLFFITDVIPYIPIKRSQFYNLNLDKSDNIKGALEKNKIAVKTGLRKKWYESGNPTTEIALYKLIGTEEEADRISNQRTTIAIDTDHLKAIEKAFEGLENEDVQPES